MDCCSCCRLRGLGDGDLESPDALLGTTIWQAAALLLFLLLASLLSYPLSLPNAPLGEEEGGGTSSRLAARCRSGVEGQEEVSWFRKAEEEEEESKRCLFLFGSIMGEEGGVRGCSRRGERSCGGVGFLVGRRTAPPAPPNSLDPPAQCRGQCSWPSW